MNDLKDRIVMITGASSGFGKEAAKMCVELGAKVVLGARREDKLKELCDELGTDSAIYKATDVTSKEQMHALAQHGIKTFTVAYGSGLSGSGINNLRDMAKAGGTNDVIIASTAASLKTQLKAAISQVIASKLSFTAPAITATIEKGGSLYQAQFDYVQNAEWQGTLKRTAINSSGVVDPNDKGNWSASDKLPTPDKRKIWTILTGVDYKTDYKEN